MPAAQPTISVIIPHLNQPEQLEACLTSLDIQTLDRKLFQIIVVDNGSTSPLEPILRRHPNVLILHEPTAGPGPARNRGARSANGDIFCFIDADCRAHPDWLRAILVAFPHLPEKSILGGDVQIWHEPGSNDVTAIEAYECVFAYRQKMYIEQHGFSGTGNLAVRRTDFEHIGPFSGISVAEDREWGHRALAAGYKFHYVPEMIVFHPARRFLGELFQKWDRHVQHDLNEARNKPWWKTRWLARAFAVLASPFFDCVTVLNSNRLSKLSARLKAIAVLFCIRAYRASKMIVLLGSKAEVRWNRQSRGGPDNARRRTTRGTT